MKARRLGQPVKAPVVKAPPPPNTPLTKTGRYQGKDGRINSAPAISGNQFPPTGSPYF